MLAQFTWQLATGKDISFLLTIQQNHGTLMLNVSEIVNFLADDAKKGEVSKKPAFKPAPKSAGKKFVSPTKSITAPMQSAPRSMAN